MMRIVKAIPDTDILGKTRDLSSASLEANDEQTVRLFGD
jgi:hypothetical protein